MKKALKLSVVLLVLAAIYGFAMLYRETAQEILRPLPTPVFAAVEIAVRHADGTRDRYQVPPSQVFEFTKSGTEANLLVSGQRLDIKADDVVCITTSAVPPNLQAVGDVEGTFTCLTAADAQ